MYNFYIDKKDFIIVDLIFIVDIGNLDVSFYVVWLMIFFFV